MNYNPDSPPEQAAINPTTSGYEPLRHEHEERDKDGVKTETEAAFKCLRS